MKVTVDFYGGLRLATGKDEIALTLDETITVNSLLELLHEQYPEIRKLSKITIVSLNRGLANGLETLKDGDEVLLLSSLAGG